MRKIFRINVVLLTSLLCFTGCSDLSEQEPKISILEENVTGEINSQENGTTINKETQEIVEIEKETEIAKEVFKKYVVTCPKLNVRSKQSTDSEILDVYLKNTIVTACKEEDSNWGKIILEDGKDVYVSFDYLNDIHDSELKEYEECQIKEKKDAHGIIPVSSGNVRLFPNITTGTVVGNLVKGTLFNIVGITNNDWYAIEYNNDICYISNEVATVITEEEYQAYITKLEKGNFNESTATLIGSYSTDYKPANTNRGYNVEKASSEMDCLIIPPNAIFNWCRDMGPCGKDEGYMSSDEIVNGQYVTGYGGGICQVSSTLCAAVIKSEAKFEFIERYKHSKTQKYIPRELDATVSYPTTNFVVKNCNDFPIMIKSYCNDGNVIVELYKIN